MCETSKSWLKRSNTELSGKNETQEDTSCTGDEDNRRVKDAFIY